MKTLRTTFIVSVALLDIYYIVMWIVSFNKYMEHSERVSFFLQNWFFFQSVVVLNFILLVLTTLNLISLNYKLSFHKPLKLAINLVFILFIFFIVWTMI
jgi:hypothetical protein